MPRSKRPSAEQRGAESAPTPRARATKRPRAARPKSAPPPDPVAAGPAPDDPAYRPGNSRQGCGRLASEIQEEAAEYFWPPWVLQAELTLVVGVPNAGKSSLGALLCSYAARPAILPGYEEAIGSSLLRRLRAADVDLTSCLILDDRHWLMPQDRDDLAGVLHAHQCDLLWIDPIDSYVSVENENDGSTVRAALEAFARLAHEARCAVVGARHPGKHLTNLCPGSRQWQAVPRQLVELRYEDGPPERRWMRMRKDPHGSGRVCHTYTICGEEGGPGWLQLGGPVALEIAQTWGESDAVDEWKITDCMEFLRGRLAEGPMDARELYALGLREGFDDRKIRMAARRLGLKSTRSGKGAEHKSTYPRCPSGTPGERETHPPPPDLTAAGGCVSLSPGVTQAGGPANGVPRPRSRKQPPGGTSHATSD